MRLIDAEALIKDNGLENAIKYANRLPKQQTISYSTMRIDEIAEMIDNAPTIDAEPIKHGELWVSCSERMPETLTETLDGWYSECCLVFAEETEWMGMAYYRTNDNKSWWEFADAQNKPKIDWAEITHWMPLPNYPNCGARMDVGADHLDVNTAIDGIHDFCKARKGRCIDCPAYITFRIENGDTVQTCKFRCDAPVNWEHIDIGGAEDETN